MKRNRKFFSILLFTCLITLLFSTVYAVIISLTSINEEINIDSICLNATHEYVSTSGSFDLEFEEKVDTKNIKVEITNSTDVVLDRYYTINLKKDTRNIGNAQDYYIIDENNKLSITVLPEYTKCSCVRVSFEFTDNETKEYVTVDLNIEYIIANDENVSGYLSYYNEAITYIDELTITHYHENDSEIIKNGFSMPFAFSNGAPYTIYDFAEVYTTNNYTDEKNNFNYYENVVYKNQTI